MVNDALDICVRGEQMPALARCSALLRLEVFAAGCDPPRGDGGGACSGTHITVSCKESLIEGNLEDKDPVNIFLLKLKARMRKEEI